MRKAVGAFSLIELLIAIAIIAIISAVIVPNFQRSQPGYERAQFIARLNSLIQFAWQQAITTHTIHRVSFDFEKRRIATFYQATTKGPAAQSFKPVRGFSRSSFSWPEHYVVKEFLIEGFDEMKRSTSKATQEVWFYIIPDGLTQAVIINMLDNKDKKAGKPRPFSLVLNPFNAQFKVYDTFQR